MVCVPSAIKELFNDFIGCVPDSILDAIAGHELGRVIDSLKAARAEIIVPCSF